MTTGIMEDTAMQAITVAGIVTVIHLVTDVPKDNIA